MVCFFFSSRRRHTRCSRDWSSDVCSSDLEAAEPGSGAGADRGHGKGFCGPRREPWRANYRDRKSTRLNSSHGYISYAVFCLKKKKKPKCTTIIVNPTRDDKFLLTVVASLL